MKLDLSKIQNVQVENIRMYDYPDFVDAYISYAEIDGRELTEDELDALNENQDFRYNAIMERVY